MANRNRASENNGRTGVNTEREPTQEEINEDLSLMRYRQSSARLEIFRLLHLEQQTNPMRIIMIRASSDDNISNNRAVPATAEEATNSNSPSLSSSPSSSSSGTSPSGGGAAASSVASTGASRAAGMLPRNERSREHRTHRDGSRRESRSGGTRNGGRRAGGIGRAGGSGGSRIRVTRRGNVDFVPGVSRSNSMRLDGQPVNAMTEADRRDELFEEYIRQQPSPDDIEIFNTELPTEHSYLGSMDRVSGIDIFEPGKTYHIPVCSHHSIVFPGETLPMIMGDSIFDGSEQDGVTFGIVFWEHPHKNKFYGVICQVFERGVADGNITIKSRARQRFVVLRQKDGTYTKTKYRNHRECVYSDVKILPEVLLPDPLLPMTSNNLCKFGNTTKRRKTFRNFIARSSAWPAFVYEQYETEQVLEKVHSFLGMLNIESTLPTDPVLLAFWLARNIPITDKDRIEIFLTNSVTQRMLILGKSLDVVCYFICKRCTSKIAKYNEMFAMSKQGIQTNYCNPSGHIHDTLTVARTIENAVYLVDRASSEFSWFPGYAWQIIMCNHCSGHLGWKFVATNKNLVPRMFYGLSGKSISVETVSKNPLSMRKLPVPDEAIDGIETLLSSARTAGTSTAADNPYI